MQKNETILPSVHINIKQKHTDANFFTLARLRKIGKIIRL